VAAVPLQHEGRLLGALAALTYEPNRRFGPLDAESLELWAGVAAAALVGLERAQLRGVTVTARELADRLNNALALPIGTIELLQHRAHLPPDLHGLLNDAANGLAEAARCIARLQRVVRFATRDTPHGPALDLERSTN
jgi:GAF domain-containing protein